MVQSNKKYREDLLSLVREERELLRALENELRMMRIQMLAEGYPVGNYPRYRINL